MTRVEEKLPDGALREVDPEIRETVDRLNELSDERDAVEEQLRELRQTDDLRGSSVKAEAEAYLDGEEPEGGVAVGSTVEEQVEELERKRRMLDRALDLQQKRLRERENERVEELAERIYPEYRELMQEIADRLADLSELVGEEAEIRHRLDESTPFGSSWRRVFSAPAPAGFWHNLVPEMPGGERSMLDRALSDVIDEHDLDDPRD